jgi:glycosyltransferase involved in cell wall biosynthesis
LRFIRLFARSSLTPGAQNAHAHAETPRQRLCSRAKLFVFKGLSEMQPSISIVVPTYKRPQKLARTLASIAPACSSPHEIIVVDDCPDGSAFPIAMQFGAQYMCKAGRDRGLSQSRNIGIALARGKYLAFIDDDDFFSPNSLDTLLSTADRNTFIFGDFVEVHADKLVHHDLRIATQDNLLIANQIPVGAYLIEKTAIKRNFDERMRSHEDWDFLLTNIDWQRCKHVQTEIVRVDKTENGTTSMQARRSQFFWMDFLSIYSKFPAPYLSSNRKGMLAQLGVNLDENMLKHGDVI